ncbi:MAG: hypothetical protein L3J73_04060, partial [Thermoplasmata archaeon]|nr:hypothetical protein [Thermoplasmata archaeon]
TRRWTRLGEAMALGVALLAATSWLGTLLLGSAPTWAAALGVELLIVLESLALASTAVRWGSGTMLRPVRAVSSRGVP